VTLMFPLLKPTSAGGPPHGVSFELYEKLLSSTFDCIDGPKTLPDTLSHEGRGDGSSGIARWMRK
jgi:hypothetical protein